MTPQEIALVTILLERLKATAREPKDSEADALIRGTTAEQPDVAYYLAQTVLIHDLSLHNAQNRITELEKNLAEAKTAASPPTSFLAGLLDAYQPATQPAEPLPSNAATPAWPALAAQSGNLALAAPNAGSASGMGTGHFLRAAAETAALITKGERSNHENRTDCAALRKLSA
jgi:uncharacterized protein